MTVRPDSDPLAPYVGLRPFEFNEAALLYGRGEHIAEMVRTLRKRHFLAVVGSSGSGKSSLVRAGLLPAIAAGFMDDDEATDWRFVIMRPGRDPYENLLRELLPQLAPGQELDPKTIEFRRETLRGGPRGLLEAVDDSLLPEPTRLVVLVDQFEEIFRFLERGGSSLPEDGSSLADRRNAALAFVDMLLATVAERDPHVYVVLTMRSEYLGECEAFLGLSAAIAKSQFLTPRMTREQIKDIIERPIQAVGGRIEPQVVTDLLNALGTAQDQLPRVEHALLRMWDRACKIREEHPEANQPHTFAPDDYLAVGRFETALDLHGEQLFWDLGPGFETPEPSEKQRVAEHLFRSLAVRSPQGALVRRLCSLGEVASIAGVSEQVVAEVVEHFRQPGCNFLVASPSSPLTGKTTLDISHEALLRQWVRLGKWLDEEAKSAADYCRLETDARSWQKKEKGFLQSPELDISLQQKQKWTPGWARRYGTDFDLAMRYLEESQAEKKRRDAEDEAERNELAGERARSAQAAQLAARSRRTALVFAAVGVAGAVLAIFAVVQSREAGKQSREANKQSKIATSVSIAARAYQLCDERLDAALAIATEAQQIAAAAQPEKLLPDVFGTLLTAAYYNPRLLTHLHWDSPVNAVAFNREGDRLATGHFSGPVVLWDTETHRKIETFPGLAKGAVRAIAFSADGHYLAASSGSVQLHDRTTGETKPVPLPPQIVPPVYSLAFSSDTTLLAYGDKKGNVVIRDLMAGSDESLPDVPKNPVRGISFDRAGKIMAAGCQDGTILIWTRNELGKFSATQPIKVVPDLNAPEEKREENQVRCLMVSPDGKYLSVGRWSGAVDLYELSSNDPPAEGPPPPLEATAFGRHDALVNSLAFAADSKRLITAGKDGTVRLWNVPSMEQVGPSFTGHVGRVFGVAFSGHDEQTAASGGEDGRTILWKTKDYVAQTVRAEKPDRPFTVAFSPDGTWEAYGYDQGKVTLRKRDPMDWEKYHEEELPAASPDEKGVSLVTFSGDNLRLATATPGGPLRVYDLSKDIKDVTPPIKEIAVGATARDASQNYKITSIGLSRDGSRIGAGFTTSGKQQARIWIVATPDKFEDLPPDSGIDEDIGAIRFSSDETRVVLAGGEKAVIWWVGDSGKSPKTKPLTDHTGSVRGLAFSPDGKTFATASGDTTLILWDASGRAKSPPLTGHKTAVVTAAFSHDGKWLASGSEDNSVILWDVETGLFMGRLTDHSDTVRALAFSPSDKHLYSGSWNGESRLWQLDPAKLQEICRWRANRNLSETEWKAYIRTGKYPKTRPTLPSATASQNENSAP